MEKQEMALPPLPWLEKVLSGGHRKVFVGLDIGSHSIKMVKLQRGHPQWKVTTVSTELSPDTIVEGRIMNFAAVVEAIGQLIQETGSYGLECGVSIFGHALILKNLSLPEMSKAELDESLLWEAETYIPFDIKDVYVDAAILNPRAGQGQMDVLMLAARKDVVNEYISVAVEAGLKPVVVDAGIVTLLNLLKTNYLEAITDETVLLVNVGANWTNVSVLSNGLMAFSRDIAMGSAYYTAELQEAFNIPWEKAELWKQFEEDDAEMNETTEADNFIAAKKQVGEIADKFVAQVITEIQRSTDFFVATSIKAQFSRLYLTGGGAVNYRLIKELERRLEIPVEMLNPFKGMSTQSADDTSTVGNSWAVAMGLALRGLDDETPDLVRINLLGRPSQPVKSTLIRDCIISVATLFVLFWRLIFNRNGKKLKVSATEMRKLAFVLGYTFTSGMPLLDIFSEVARWLDEPLHRALLQVRAKVAEGKCAAESFEKAGFPPLFCLMVRTGEIRGNVASAFIDYLEVTKNHPEFGL